MSLLSNVVGFSLFGLAVRLGQLGIQRRNLASNLGGHALSMAGFGVVGYYAYEWEVKSGQLIEKRKKEISERRRKLLEEAGGEMAVIGERPLDK